MLLGPQIINVQKKKPEKTNTSPLCVIMNVKRYSATAVQFAAMCIGHVLTTEYWGLWAGSLCMCSLTKGSETSTEESELKILTL